MRRVMLLIKNNAYGAKLNLMKICEYAHRRVTKGFYERV